MNPPFETLRQVQPQRKRPNRSNRTEKALLTENPKLPASSPSDHDPLTISPSRENSSFQTPPRQVQAQRKEPNESNQTEGTVLTNTPKLPASSPSASPQQKDDPNWNPLGSISGYTPLSHKLSRQKEEDGKL